MLTKYHERPEAGFCYGSIYRNERDYFTYASCLDYSRSNGIMVKSAPASASGNDTPCSHVKKESLCSKGLLHYKEWWERREVDISVNRHMLTGIPIFTGHNALRVVNGDHSYFIPLEKVDFIRTTDGINIGNQN